MPSDRLLITRFVQLGVPISSPRLGPEVWERARCLAGKRPDFYAISPQGDVLWTKTVDSEVFDPIYDWVLYGKGTEPN